MDCGYRYCDINYYINVWHDHNIESTGEEPYHLAGHCCDGRWWGNSNGSNRRRSAVGIVIKEHKIS